MANRIICLYLLPRPYIARISQWLLPSGELRMIASRSSQLPSRRPETFLPNMRNVRLGYSKSCSINDVIAVRTFPLLSVKTTDLNRRHLLEGKVVLGSEPTVLRYISDEKACGNAGRAPDAFARRGGLDNQCRLGGVDCGEGRGS